MAATHGKSGVVQVATVGVGEVLSWSYKENNPEVDVTAMGASGKSFLSGLGDGTFDIECNFDDADAGQEDLLDALSAGTAVTVNLYYDGDSTTTGNDYLTGSITINSFEVSANTDSAINCKFSGRGFMSISQIA